MENIFECKVEFNHALQEGQNPEVRDIMVVASNYGEAESQIIDLYNNVKFVRSIELVAAKDAAEQKTFTVIK